MAVTTLPLRVKHDRAAAWVRHQTELDSTLRSLAEGFYGGGWISFLEFVAWLLERHLIHMPLPVDVGLQWRDQAQDQAAGWLDFYRAQDPKLGALVERAGEQEAVELLMELIAWQINHDFLAEH